MGRMESPDRSKRVTIRADEDLLEAYDEVCEDRGVSRSASIREHMERTVADAELTDRRMPKDDDLAAAYRTLLRRTKGGGWIPRDQACKALAQTDPHVDADGAYGTLIKPLRQLGYLKQQVTSDGRSVSLKVRA